MALSCDVKQVTRLLIAAVEQVSCEKVEDKKLLLKVEATQLGYSLDAVKGYERASGL